MKKLNVQKDLDSRARISVSQAMPTVPETIVELKINEKDAESEKNKECENNESSPLTGKKAKGRRPPSGNNEKI